MSHSALFLLSAMPWPPAPTRCAALAVSRLHAALHAADGIAALRLFNRGARTLRLGFESLRSETDGAFLILTPCRALRVSATPLILEPGAADCVRIAVCAAGVAEARSYRLLIHDAGADKIVLCDVPLLLRPALASMETRHAA